MAQRGTARARGGAAATELATCGEGSPDADSDSDDDELSLKQWEKLDVRALALSTAKSVVQRRPVLVSAWTFGLSLAAFAGGLPVSSTASEAYSIMFQHAEVIDSRELGRALDQLQQEEEAYYNTRGWFGACDENCQRARDKAQLARADVVRLQGQRDKALSEARREVGIWSSFGVQDVRRSFWDAWKSGKDFAARWTMMDMIFMNVGGREQTLVTLAMQVVMRYVVNLTMGMIGAFFFFVHNVYCLVVSYGESVLSGTAFLMLAVVAGLSTVGAYLCAVYGTVAGGGLILMRQAALQAVTDGQGRASMKLRNNPWTASRNV
eukprot:CAMPEP_0175516008 /NCGR_PEP_ID=MMETSP0096-20121207/14228_1 /TAXON_ID=311494 /ORGANISM="Alexandrium monilatum, Strain CCMP3105" /LENGTH=321 /DNA_ID=CAMNT_0016818293 /DNA_START=41 /DNA_END=1006 /DNA_ORIENTATION=-